MKTTLLFIFFSEAVFGALITNQSCVHFTTDLKLYLQNEWGLGATNQFYADEMISRTLEATGTNVISFRALPARSQFYSFTLCDKSGNAVPKSPAGIANSSPSSQSVSEIDLRRNYKIQSVKYSDTRQMFRPSEMFLITNSGIYTLEVKMRICVPVTNKIPDVEAMADFRKTALASNVAIIESPPLLVNVIKK